MDEPRVKTLTCEKAERCFSQQASATQSRRDSTCLEHVAEVDEHVVGLLHSASDVQARSDNVARLSSLVEVVTDGEVEPSTGRVAQSFRELESERDLLDSTLACATRRRRELSQHVWSLTTGVEDERLADGPSCRVSSRLSCEPRLPCGPLTRALTGG